MQASTLKDAAETVTERLGPVAETVTERLAPVAETVTEKLAPVAATVTERLGEFGDAAYRLAALTPWVEQHRGRRLAPVDAGRCRTRRDRRPRVVAGEAQARDRRLRAGGRCVSGRRRDRPPPRRRRQLTPSRRRTGAGHRPAPSGSGPSTGARPLVSAAVRRAGTRSGPTHCPRRTAARSRPRTLSTGRVTCSASPAPNLHCCTAGISAWKKRSASPTASSNAPGSTASNAAAVVDRHRRGAGMRRPLPSVSPAAVGGEDRLQRGDHLRRAGDAAGGGFEQRDGGHVRSARRSRVAGRRGRRTSARRGGPLGQPT